MSQKITRDDILQYREYKREFRMSRRDRLALDVERALQEYLGVDSFTGEEYPKLAQAFADVVVSAQINGGCASLRDVVDGARDLLGNLTGLVDAVRELVE